MGSEKLMGPNNDQTHLEKTVNRKNWFVYFCSFTADLLIISYGFAMSWHSSVIPKLKMDDPDINPLSSPLTTMQISTLAALPAVGGCIGYISAPKLSDSIGRIKILIFVATLLVISFITLAFVKDIYVYYLCVFINGFCESTAVAIVTVYNTEIAQDAIRGKIVGLMVTSMPLGALIGYFSGITNIQIIAIVGMTFPGLFLLFCFFLKESPVYLASKGRELDCLKSLETFRRRKNVEAEYEKILETVNTTKKIRKLTPFAIFKTRTSIKAFVLSLELCCAQHATGVFVLWVFMAPIFNEAGSYLSGNAISIIAGSVKLTFVLSSAFIVDKLGRRPLLLVSILSCVFILFFLGFYFYLTYVESVFVEKLRWLPILCVVLYYIGYSIGMGPLPLIVTSELFTNDLRPVGVATILICHSILLFATLFTFPLISAKIGVHVSLWICCLCSFIGFFTIYFTVPETKRKSFMEIQDILKGEIHRKNTMPTRSKII